MKKFYGIILILLTFLLTYIFWIYEHSAKEVSVYRGYSQLIASFALVSLAWINYISSRHRYLDKVFYGLDKSYIYHKYLSILAIIFIWVHDFTLRIGKSSEKRSFEGNPIGTKFPPEGFKRPEGGATNILGMHISGRTFASWSMLIFTILVIFFIIAYKLEYERWKILHKLLLVPYVFGLIHYYLDSDYPVFSLTAYSIWMNLINAIGVLSALYSIFIYERTAFKYRYKVSNIREVAKGTLEITGTSTNNGMKYKPGQFAFIKVFDRKKGFPSHPFTICETYKPGVIQFAIKALGDHTDKLLSSLSIGDSIAISGPFGRFDFISGTKHQIWVAGGIGITPFRSFWQSEIPANYTVDLFYAYNNEGDGPYVDELKAIEPRENLRIHLFDSSKTGFLGIEDFNRYLNKDYEFDVYFCGPKGMRVKIKNDLKENNYKIREFHYEHFQFK